MAPTRKCGHCNNRKHWRLKPAFPFHYPDKEPDMSATRIEHDLLGEREVPADGYWGIHTLRALENFAITGKSIGSYPDLMRALALVKQAATLANRDLGELEPALADAITAACEDIAGGQLHDQFVVDVIQGGAGTSTNMNANE